MKREELLLEVDRLARLAHLSRQEKAEAAVARYERMLMPDLARHLKLAVEAIIWIRNRAEDPSSYGPAQVVSEVRKNAQAVIDDVEETPKQ